MKTLQYKSRIIIEYLSDAKQAAARTQVYIALSSSLYGHFISFFDKWEYVSLWVGMYLA